MTDSSAPVPEEHPLEAMIEACAMGHLSEEAGKKLETMLAGEPRAAKRARELRRELQDLKARLQHFAWEDGQEEPDDLTLARYIDDALDTEDRRRVETRLSRSRDARARLAAIYRHLKTITDPEQVIEEADRHPAGETVTLENSAAAARRQKEPERQETGVNEKRGMENNDEDRKQRYSSGRS
jgi:anti-sigma-K factor RskA